jgi:hypothetical protein
MIQPKLGALKDREDLTRVLSETESYPTELFSVDVAYRAVT